MESFQIRGPGEKIVLVQQLDFVVVCFLVFSWLVVCLLCLLHKPSEVLLLY